MTGGRAARRLLFVAALAGVAACSGAVPIARRDLERLSAAPAPIPVAWVPSPSPWVDCPGNEGERLYELPGNASREPPRVPAPPARPRAGDAAALSVQVASRAPVTGGGIWRAIVNDYTERLRRSPPVDPARATAEALVAAARSAAGPPLGPGAEATDRTTPHALASRFGPRPVLVVEAPRFVLVGCFYAFQPWFDARATLVDAETGRVIWRGVCRDVYPPDGAGSGASPPQLEAGGDALYRQALEERAGDCARRLVASLMRPAPARAGRAGADGPMQGHHPGGTGTAASSVARQSATRIPSPHAAALPPGRFPVRSAAG